jgi:hypothetical protein
MCRFDLGLRRLKKLLSDDYLFGEVDGWSVPQLRHEPITYSFFLPQLGQFSAIEVAMLSLRRSNINSQVYRHKLKDSRFF